MLKRAVTRARLGRREELDALRRLDDEARRIDGVLQGPSFAEYVATERAQSAVYDGRTA